MSKILKLLVVLAAASVVTTGCAVNRATATVDPSAKLAGMKAIHVTKQPADDHDIDILIAEKLRSRGYTVTTGNDTTAQADALVTYRDKWMWDITMYLLELTVTIREPKTDYPLATGNSFHTSLSRKSPKEMVDEVMENIFKEGGIK